MSRVKRGVTAHSRHLKVIKAAKGARGRQKNTFRAAIQRVEKSGQYAYRDRKVKKRTFRGLWIQRINAAARELGYNYSVLISKLNASGYDINRKMLADLAVKEPDSFKALLEQVNKS
ncbi:MAG: 50S ribosomal protein L20 [Pelagibacterales bacterium]|nr:50S ribosomal protein L20 [Pelagibacterales bacterium]|tara:strand:- start:119 stop:469 length:351 start_codon:yes stop_codon:yes gene_type:complete